MSVCAAVWWANRASVYTSTRKHEITNEIHRNHRNYYITVMDMDTVIQMVIKITSLSQHTIMLGYIYIQSSVMNHLQMNINFLTVGKNINTHTAFNVMVAHDPPTHSTHAHTEWRNMLRTDDVDDEGHQKKSKTIVNLFGGFAGTNNHNRTHRNMFAMQIAKRKL